MKMTPEQIERAAQEYAADQTRKALDLASDCINHTDALIAKFCGKDIEGAFKAGASYALSNQWIPVDERLPEEKKAVLCYMPDMKDTYAEKDMYFDMAILLEGEFVNLDADVIHPSHWMPIPIPPCNPEKEER